MLLDILFVWSKLNPDISYRQGMHEVLAPLVWAVERDAIDVSDADSPSKTQHDEQILTIFDAAHVEHDSFALFTTVMDSLKTAYAARSSKGKGHEYSNSVGSVPEIVARSHKILHEQLMAADPQLAFHLIGLDIPPQLFLMYAGQRVPNLYLLLTLLAAGYGYYSAGSSPSTTAWSSGTVYFPRVLLQHV